MIFRKYVQKKTLSIFIAFSEMWGTTSFGLGWGGGQFFVSEKDWVGTEGLGGSREGRLSLLQFHVWLMVLIMTDFFRPHPQSILQDIILWNKGQHDEMTLYNFWRNPTTTASTSYQLLSFLMVLFWKHMRRPLCIFQDGNFQLNLIR